MTPHSLSLYAYIFIMCFTLHITPCIVALLYKYLGEEENRQIASGLVPYYSLEDMQDRRVIVVANLLPRKLVGFKSFGMVLCASKEG